MLTRTIGGHPLVYLDSAATAQKPLAVLDAMEAYYRTSCANINRGVHVLAEEATTAYEDARENVRSFLHAKEATEIIFTRGTTEAINLIARSMDAHLSSEDTIVISGMEHHSNIVPWQQLAARTGCSIAWVDVDARGTLDLGMMRRILERSSTKMMAITGLSNVLGAKTPLKDIINMAHEHGALTLVDAAQLVVHAALDVQDLGCDFLAFSGHKIYGPTGIGILYGKKDLLKNCAPLLGGGNMVDTVRRDGFVPATLPRKLEAGTPPIAEAIGLSAAITWLRALPRKDSAAHEALLLTHARHTLAEISGITVLGPDDPLGCLSFVTDGVHPHDLTDVLGRRGICLRAGHHCAQPLHATLGIPATTRLSVGLYTTEQEIDQCSAAIEEVVRFLRR